LIIDPLIDQSIDQIDQSTILLIDQSIEQLLIDQLIN